jgi:hypothetical protein
MSRDAQRRFARPGRPPGHQPGAVAAIVHGPHDRAWLYSGTIGASGQARINAKRNARAEFWRTVRIRVSAEAEPYFRDSLHLLGVGARIDGRTEPLSWWAVDLDVHIPGAPADAVFAEPVYRSERTGDGYQPVLDHVQWLRADGSTIHGTSETGAAQ